MKTSKSFKKVNGIFQCKLLLENGSEFIIPMREDGYIFATALCKTVGKKTNDWLRLKETKEFIKELENFDAGIPVSKIIEVYKAGNKCLQGTWVHPDLGIQLAQWCSSSFSLQVSKWVRELIITDEVKLGNEKSEENIKTEYDNIIKKLENKLKEAENNLERTESIIKSQGNENKHLLKKFNKLYSNHEAYLKRKKLYKLKQGQCIYLVNTKGLENKKEHEMKIKIGVSGDITDRIAGFRTNTPFCKLLYVMYTPGNLMIESNMKMRHEENLTFNNREFISNIPLEELIKDLHMFADILKTPFEIETEEELEKFNGHIIPMSQIEASEQELKELDEIVDREKHLKRCGGDFHETEESRMLSLDKFFKNKSNRDGVARLCKECYLSGVYGDDRKRRKIVAIPEYNILTHKWCNLCEFVKEHKMFFKDKATKDNLASNCKECKHKQKIKNKKSKEQVVTI